MRHRRSMAAMSLVGLALSALLAACATAPSAPERFVPDFAEPFELGPDDVVEPPAVLERRHPIYPRELLALGREGRVVARGVIGRDGRLRDVQIVRSDHPLFSEALLEAVAGWRFRPAAVDGEPVAVYYQLVHDFTLR